MASHKVVMTLPSSEVKRADASFSVERDGMKLGTLEVQTGSLVWFPAYTKYGRKIGWKKFDELIEDDATKVEKR